MSELKNVNIRLAPEQYDKCKDVAKRYGHSLEATMQMLMTKGLDALEVDGVKPGIISKTSRID